MTLTKTDIVGTISNQSACFKNRFTESIETIPEIIKVKVAGMP